MKPNLKQPISKTERTFRAIAILAVTSCCLLFMKYQQLSAVKQAEQAKRDSIYSDSLTRVNLKPVLCGEIKEDEK